MWVGCVAVLVSKVSVCEGYAVVDWLNECVILPRLNVNSTNCGRCITLWRAVSAGAVLSVSRQEHVSHCGWCLVVLWMVAWLFRGWLLGCFVDAYLVAMLMGGRGIDGWFVRVREVEGWL